MKLLVLSYLFLSRFWNAVPKEDESVPVQILITDGVINIIEDQNLTVFVNTEVFEIIPDDDLSVVTITPNLPRMFERHWKREDTAVTLATYIYEPVSIDYDWIGKNIYWLQYGVLEAGDLNGKYRTTLYRVPFGIDMAIDSNTASVFYVFGGVSPGIEIADMDGTELSRKVIVTGPSVISKDSLSISLDTEKGIVYWSDKTLRRIQRCHYDGSQVEIVIQFEEDILPTSIDINEDTIYWIQYNTLTVNMLSLSTGKSETIAVLPGSILMNELSLLEGVKGNYTTNKIHMKFFDPEAQIKDVNENLLLTANCSQLFLLSKQISGFKCVCGTGYYLVDNNTCERFEDITIAVVSSPDKKISLIQNRTEVTLNNEDEFQFLDIDYGETDNDLIFCSPPFNLHSSTITNFTQNMKSLISSQSLSVFLVAYDWLSRNIYITVPAYSIDSTSIIVLSGYKYMYQIQHFAARATGFSLDCNNGLLFVSRPSRRVITKYGMDGTVYGKNIFVYPNEGIIFGLALDLEEQKVYWNTLFNYLYRMWRCSYSGNHKEELLNFRLWIIDMFIFENFLFVAEMTGSGEKMISRYNKYSMGDFTKYYTFNETFQAMATYNYKIRQKGSSPCMINNGNCSQLCLLSPRKPYYICRCDSSYKLESDSKSCALMECKIENGGCGMDCIDLKGGRSHKCVCRNGFTLQKDNKSCAGELNKVLISSISSGLVLVDIKRNMHIFMHLNITVLDMTFNPVNRYLYIVRLEDSHIIKIPFNEKGSVIVTHKKRIRIAIDVDWLSDIIYWWNTEEIWSFKYDNESETEIRLYKIRRIQAVQIDFLNGYIYIAGAEEIDIYSLDGIDTYMFCLKLNTIDKSSLIPCKWNRIPMGKTTIYRMTLDMYNLKMYIFRNFPSGVSQEERLEVSNLDGQRSKTIKQSKYIYPDIHSLEVVDGVLYATGINAISRVDKQNGDQTIVFHKQYILNFKNTGTHNKGFNVMPRAGDDEQCMDHEKCFGLVNKWICLKPDDICDGTPLCHENYDEFLCSLCTKNCEISSLEIYCNAASNKHVDVLKLSKFFSWEFHPFSKLIDLKRLLQFDCSLTFDMKTSSDQVKMYEIHSVYHLHKLRQLIMIPLFKNLKTLQMIKLVGLPLLENLTAGNLTVVENISSMYLEGSFIASLPKLAFQGLLALRELYLVNNKYLKLFDPDCFKDLTSLRLICITGSEWLIVSKNQFLDQGNLTSLNLSSNKIQILENGVFNNLGVLKLIDLRFNRIILTSNLFLQSMYLEVIYGDSFTICCIKPDGVACFASADDISSCKNLIADRVLAAFLWILGIMAFLGNLTVLIYRTFVDKSFYAKSYFIFVYNLCISDLVMALYMLIIAVHDARYDGTYVWNDFTWRNSTLCKVAGVLSMLSSEASLIFISLISLERFLIVKFTFGNVRISRKLAFKLSLITWVVACFVSMFPLATYDDFFARSGICIAIPLTKEINSGMEYAVVVFLGINFLISSFIPYVLYQIYTEVKKSMKRVQSTQTGRDIQVAKRLSIVVITDCLCWLPVGILVILSLAGIKTPSEVYSWVIVLVLPLNAAINPYIYTYSKLDKMKCFRCMKKINKRHP